jgi:hypothetical protein
MQIKNSKFSLFSQRGSVQTSPLKSFVARWVEWEKA